MHRGLHQLVWYFHNSNAVDDSILNHTNFVIYFKKEIFEMKKQYIVLFSSVCLVIVIAYSLIKVLLNLVFL